MKQKYTTEENVLQLISLLKAHGITRIVASPGSTNIPFVGSVQNDPFFKIYSCIDERSAAYLACGMAEESGEPVVISCTGATAARNYPSGLTEAFYRKLPILALTSSQPFGRVGHLYPQFTDRNVQFNDIATMSVQIPYPYSVEERWSNNAKINNALLQLKRHGCGPVHINLQTTYSKDFSTDNLPDERVIKRYTIYDSMPDLKATKVCIFVGSHKKFPQDLEKAVDEFCEKYNAIVLCDQTSNYKGKYRILGGLVAGQQEYTAACQYCDLMIHLGEVSGSYFKFANTKIWRVSIDGEVRDTFKLLSAVFEMDEKNFFECYNRRRKNTSPNTYLDEWKSEIKKIDRIVGDLPLSNVWMCQQTAHRLPENSVLYLGILNSLRSWNLYDTPKSVYSYSTVGGFGIDGGLSSCVGASLVYPEKIYFCVIGDIAFFYDLNILGNRNIRHNFRILLVNNGTGYEMHCANSTGINFDAEERDRFFAAGGHNGNKSRDLVRHFAEDLGFEYMKAESKEEYLEKVEHFISPELTEKPILFEVFVKMEDDDYAYNATKITLKDGVSMVKQMAKGLLGEKGFSQVRRIIKG